MNRIGCSKNFCLIVALIVLVLFAFGLVNNIRWMIPAALIGGFFAGYMAAMFAISLVMAKQNLTFDDKANVVSDAQIPKRPVIN